MRTFSFTAGSPNRQGVPRVPPPHGHAAPVKGVTVGGVLKTLVPMAHKYVKTPQTRRIICWGTWSRSDLRGVARCVVTSPLVAVRSIAMSVYVRLYVCLLAHLNNDVSNLQKNFFTCYTCDRGSVLLWRKCNTLCTSGFVDDVMFVHNGPYGAWLKMTHQGAEPGTKSWCLRLPCCCCCCCCCCINTWLHSYS